MTLYGAVLLLVVFGALVAALDLLLLVATPFLLERLDRIPPGRRTDAILTLRSLPLGLAAAATALVFLPSWWRYEPPDTGEAASTLLLALGLLAATPLALGLYRAARMFLKTRDRLLTWRGRGVSASTIETPFEVIEVTGEDLALCVGGYLRPTIYAATDVVRSLEPEELRAALAHEVSHAQRRDPLRFLWLGSCPDFLRMLGLDGSWRHAFARACEFAADAGASRGDREVALDLASALLKVARLRTFGPSGVDTLRDVAVSSAFSSRADLKARVDALANPREAPSTGSFVRPWIFVVALLALCAAGGMAAEQIHDLTEEVGHSLAP